jgi:peptide deformylase
MVFKWAACKGLLARIIQHEVGHLDGVCIKDFAVPVTTHTVKGVV